MVKLFSKRVWYAILITYFLLSMCSYLSHKVETRIMLKKLQTDLNDHFFYNFGMICGQSKKKYISASYGTWDTNLIWLNSSSRKSFCNYKLLFTQGTIVITTYTVQYALLTSIINNNLH